MSDSSMEKQVPLPLSPVSSTSASLSHRPKDILNQGSNSDSTSHQVIELESEEDFKGGNGDAEAQVEVEAGPVEAQTKPKLSLYQRIQAVVAEVKAREERERLERGDAPSPVSEGDASNSDGDDGGQEAAPAIPIDIYGRPRPAYPKGEKKSLESAPLIVEVEKQRAKIPSLGKMVERQLLKQLKEAVQGEQCTANYCCGGTVEVSSDPLDYSEPDSILMPLPTLPITLRYEDPQDVFRMGRIQFPITGESGFAVDDLLDTCHRTGALDRTHFSIDFDPNEHGIVKAIDQILLPDYGGPILEKRKEHRAVVAELSTFTVSGAKRKSKEEFDTPLRRPGWLGHLIVCLPHEREGGQLEVSHHGHTTYFDWSDSDLTTIQWAAFHSYCEHEFSPVSSGHQMVLRYDLYVTEGIGGVLKQFPTANPELLPLYEGIKPILDQGNFMKDGCTFGFYCKHLYAHTHRRAQSLMPYALQGIDATIFAVFTAAGLEVLVRPILNSETVPEWGTEYFSEHGSVDGETMESNGEKITVGDDFHPMKFDLQGGKIADWWWEVEYLKELWPHSKEKNVIWLNEATAPGKESGTEGWEVASVNMKYRPRPEDMDGTDYDDIDEELHWQLSHAVILVRVPTRRDRGATDQLRGPK